MLQKFISKYFDPKNSFRTRMFCLFGLFWTGTAIFLGAIWPSYYTIVAFFLLPAFFVFLIGVFNPKFFYKPYFLVWYLIFSIVVSVGVWIDDIFWLVNGGGIGINWNWFRS